MKDSWKLGKKPLLVASLSKLLKFLKLVEFIDDKAFDGCKNLKTVLLRGKKIELGKKFGVVKFQAFKKLNLEKKVYF